MVGFPPHLKYVARLPCNLSLMACFAHNNVSQGSVATYARWGGMFNIRLPANLLRNLPVKKIVNRLKFDKIMVVSLSPIFWSTLYIIISPHHGRSSIKYSKHNIAQNKQTKNEKT